VKETISTITSKGQLTLPAEVRRHLGLRTGDKVSFVIEDSGKVTLRVPKYPNVASLAGAAGKLDRPMNMEEMLEIAREDATEVKFHRR
jgi:antitoxin PrlF